MQNNIFQNAYFGKAYCTKDGHKGIAIEIFDDCVCLAFEELGCHYYHKDGDVFGAKSLDNMKIVSEWHEEINEEELDTLANEYDSTVDHYINNDKGYTINYRIIEAFKAGYRKGLK